MHKRTGRTGTVQSDPALPEVVVFHIIKYLNAADRINVCKCYPAWRGSLQNPRLWRQLDVSAGAVSDADIKSIQRFGRHVTNVKMSINAALIPECRAFVMALEALVKSSLRLQSIQLNAGKESQHDVYPAILELLNRPSRASSEYSWCSELIDVNFQLGPSFPGSVALMVLKHIGKHHPILQRLTIDIQPRCMSEDVLSSYRSHHILHMVNKCRELTHLHLNLCPPALCAALLDAIGSVDRLRFFSISLFSWHIIMPNAVTDLTVDVWRLLAHRLPSLQLSISIVAISTTVRQMLTAVGLDDPDALNVSRVELTLLGAEDSVRDALQAFGNTFGKSLTTCEFNFMASMEPAAEEALVRFSAQCRNLSEFYVGGSPGFNMYLSPDTVAAILSHHPVMQSNNTYLLLSS